MSYIVILVEIVHLIAAIELQKKKLVEMNDNKVGAYWKENAKEKTLKTFSLKLNRMKVW